MNAPYDRAAEDVGNLVFLEHVNLTVPDLAVATRFYVSALGLTRDPYLMTGTDVMWVNAGSTQFHLPVGPAQRLRGTVVLAMPHRQALLARLANAAAALAGTEFAYEAGAAAVEVRCPWGNRIRVVEPDPALHGSVELGIVAIEVDVAPKAAAGIGRFYAQMLGARVAADGPDAVRVSTGARQWLVFRETTAPLAAWDGHHVQVYVADFSGPHRRLLEHGLVTQESNAHQYRFHDVRDPQTGTVLLQLEHEVRSLTHPMYRRPLVNRNPAQTARGYRPGHDAWEG